MENEGVDGLIYHEIIRNDKATEWVVLVHGAGGSVRTWKSQLQAFKKHYHILLVDLRDHGNSQHLTAPADGIYTFRLMAQDIAAVMDFRGIARAHFVAVSMGTIVVRWMEEFFPAKVQSIVFAGGVFRQNIWLKMGLWVGRIASRFLPFWLLARVLSRIILPRKNHQNSRKIFLREADRIDPAAFRKWMRMTQGLGNDLEAFFQKPVTVPMLVVMGAQDHIFLPPAAAYARLHPVVQLNIIPKCGHVCNIEAAEQFNRIAITFLEAQHGRDLVKHALMAERKKPLHLGHF